MSKHVFIYEVRNRKKDIDKVNQIDNDIQNEIDIDRHI